MAAVISAMVVPLTKAVGTFQGHATPARHDATDDTVAF